MHRPQQHERICPGHIAICWRPSSVFLWILERYTGDDEQRATDREHDPVQHFPVDVSNEQDKQDAACEGRYTIDYPWVKAIFYQYRENTDIRIHRV